MIDPIMAKEKKNKTTARSTDAAAGRSYRYASSGAKRSSSGLLSERREISVNELERTLVPSLDPPKKTKGTAGRKKNRTETSAPAPKTPPAKPTKAEERKTAPSRPTPTQKRTQESAPVIAEAPKKKATSKATKSNPAAKLRVIPLGGLSEIGKNITVIEYDEDIIVVDCGMGFPDDDMPGIDLVIPDITYLENNKERIRGIFLTHGHEDHIGAIPYVLRTINPPIYGTRLTLGIIKNKLQEHVLAHTPQLH